VALPTDTVYGVAVDPSVPGATARIFEAKGRPRDVRLPVLVTDVEQAITLTTGVTRAVRGLMDRFWPGGLTIVLFRGSALTADLGNGAGTVGIRCPDHRAARALCEAVGPLATTSANLHGEPTRKTAAEVAAVFGASVAMVLDGGPCAGAPSTVVDCTHPHPRLIREGGVAWAEVLAHYDLS
jgi:tRNA threonylcarbamoyl adenosine modification protein (Sua5/YciO/YrdC/YwlC family)